ncbi:MAG: L-threonylcarbamoyladenylate synthase [Sulfolobales archaeon]
MPKAKIVQVEPLNPSEEAIREAAEILKSGGLVAFPTETVYGLGADAFNPEAVLKVFKVKRRPLDNPLIVHVSSLDMLQQVASEVPERVVKALSIAWPGPLTVVVKRKSTLPEVVSGGLDTVAVRSPAHPVALKLIEAVGRPLAAPSANIAGRPSPTRAEHVVEDLGDEIDMILDAGETFFGVESTVVDLVSPSPQILRPGPLGPEELEKIFGVKFGLPPYARGLSSYEERPPSPGMKYRHYAPSKKLVLVEKGSCDTTTYFEFLMKQLESYLKDFPALIATKETVDEVRSKLGDSLTYFTLGSRENLFEVAKNLFSTLRILDKYGRVSIAISESVEERGIGLAIMNRLRKASSERITCKQKQL